MNRKYYILLLIAAHFLFSESIAVTSKTKGDVKYKKKTEKQLNNKLTAGVDLFNNDYIYHPSLINFKISILWWLSIRFIFLTKFSPFNFILLVHSAFIIVSSESKKAEVDYAIKHNLPAESILTRKQPNTEALVPSLIVYFLFLLFMYMVNSWFVSS